METKALTKVVKVMNFQALLKVDKARRVANELMNVSEELTSIMTRIMYNKNLILDKNILIPDPSKPKLSIYIASDYGFCGNFNDMILKQILEDKDCYKIIIGKQIKYSDDKVILAMDKKSFYDRFGDIEEIIKEAILNLSYSEINIYYNHYYNSTTFDFMGKKVFPAPFEGDYYEGEDFVIETDISKMLSNMMAFYICYELQMYEKNSFASENIKRSIITRLSLDRLKEIEEENRVNELKEIREKSVLKTVENYKKSMYKNQEGYNEKKKKEVYY